MECPVQPTPCPACGYHLPTAPCRQCGGAVHQPEGHGVIPQKRRWFPLEIAHGFVGFWRGALILFRPEFAGRLRTPILANVLAFAVLGVAMFFAFKGAFDWLTSGDWGWAEGLKHGGPSIVALLMTAVAMLLLSPTLIEAVVAPFLDPLANAAEARVCGAGFRSLDLSPWRSAWRGLKASATTVLLTLGVLVPAWLLVLAVPLGTPVVFVLSAALSAVVWFEIPFARRGYGLRHRIRVLRRNWPRALGFGLAFQLGLAVPIFNLLLLTPAATMGVTLLYFHFDKDPGPPRDPGDA